MYKAMDLVEIINSEEELTQCATIGGSNAVLIPSLVDDTEAWWDSI
jgi:hypothetical protein